jgi:hypothetical protein
MLYFPWDDSSLVSDASRLIEIVIRKGVKVGEFAQYLLGQIDAGQHVFERAIAKWDR